VAAMEELGCNAMQECGAKGMGDGKLGPARRGFGAILLRMG